MFPEEAKFATYTVSNTARRFQCIGIERHRFTEQNDKLEWLPLGVFELCKSKAGDADRE